MCRADPGSMLSAKVGVQGQHQLMLGETRRIMLWDKVAPAERQAAWGSGIIILFKLLAGLAVGVLFMGDHSVHFSTG